MKKVAFYGVVLLAVFGAGIGATKVVHHYSSTSDRFHCTDSDTVKCPTEWWQDTYTELEQLQTEIRDYNNSAEAKKIQRKQWEMNGMAQSLQAQIPPGYTFDKDKRAFIAQARPKPPAPAPAAAAPPPPVKPAPVPAGKATKKK